MQKRRGYNFLLHNENILFLLVIFLIIKKKYISLSSIDVWWCWY